MKSLKAPSIIFAVLIIAASACSTSKKSTATASKASASNTKSANGIYAPGNDELAAIHAKNKDVTMQNLTEGYTIYTTTCTKCHGAKNIYSHTEAEWPGIIDNMALKARITDAQKDAVNNYVIAIKATQPK